MTKVCKDVELESVLLKILEHKFKNMLPLPIRQCWIYLLKIYGIVVIKNTLM